MNTQCVVVIQIGSEDASGIHSFYDFIAEDLREKSAILWCHEYRSELWAMFLKVFYFRQVFFRRRTVEQYYPYEILARLIQNRRQAVLLKECKAMGQPLSRTYLASPLVFIPQQQVESGKDEVLQLVILAHCFTVPYSPYAAHPICQPLRNVSAYGLSSVSTTGATPDRRGLSALVTGNGRTDEDSLSPY